MRILGSKAESTVGYLQEKMKGICGEGMMTMMKETTQAKLKETGAIFQNLKGKLKEMTGDSVMVTKETFQAKLKAMGADGMIQNLPEKFKELLLMGKNLGLSSMAWLDKVFPPKRAETRKERFQHWIHVGAPYVLPVLVLLVLFWLCRRGKTMKAPGKNFRMPRIDFEANPKGYFHSLHAGKLKYR